MKESIAGGQPNPADLPAVQPIDNFKGGTIEFRMRPVAAQDGYYVVTMFPNPPEDQEGL